MSEYLRMRVPGGTVFFTVGLAQAGSRLLVDEVERLRVAVRQTMAERPFGVRAWVVLPDHMHCVWEMPEGDADYSVRWGAIKARFSRDLRRGGFSAPPRRPVVMSGRYGGVNPALRRDKGEVAIWQWRFWEHHCPGGGGGGGLRAVLLERSCEARVGRAAGGLAVVVVPARRCPNCVGRGSPRHSWRAAG